MTTVWEFVVQNSGTLLSIAAPLLTYGGITLHVRHSTRMAKPVTRLYRSLGALAKPRSLKTPLFKFSQDPYANYNNGLARILLGRNKEGKTTLLATSIPWYRRSGPFAYKGIVFNGAAAKSSDSFSTWHTTQMFGLATTGGSELSKSLDDFRDRQWLRGFLSDFWPTFPPIGWLWFLVEQKVPFVIVEQCEELLKRFDKEDEALQWIHNLVNYQVREHKARVILVFNSKDGVQSVLNLNQGKRFELPVLELQPISREEAKKVLTPDQLERFEMCQSNIGLFKDSLQQNIPKEQLEGWVKGQLRKWSDDFHVKYPQWHDGSWHDVPHEKFKTIFLRAVEDHLQAKKIDGEPELTDEDIMIQIGCLKHSCLNLTPQRIRESTWKEWFDGFKKDLGERPAEGFAQDIKEVLGRPVPLKVAELKLPQDLTASE